MKPKILFHYPIFNRGGAEMSVLRLMHLLVTDGWDVEIVLTTGGGNLEQFIPPQIKVKHLRSRSAGHRFLSEKRLLYKLLLFPDLLAYGLYRLQGILCTLPYYFKNYDAAIISLHGLSPYFCCYQVKANKRIHWIRNDLSQCDPLNKAQKNILKYHSCIDHYVCVSKTAQHSLIKLFPFIKDKSSVLYNIINAEQMQQLAKDMPSPYPSTNLLKVVTVCRLQDQSKGLFRMLNIHKQLNDEGINFYWFVVGDGIDKARLSNQIKKLKLEHRFILMEHQDNPYPYYQYADISATLSYYEGLCGAINEAKVMGKAVIASRFSGIDEQIIDHQNGLIVENNEHAIYAGLKSLLTNDQLRKQLTNTYLPPAILDDHYKVKQLEDLIKSA